jgi:DnaJ-class molecular chaperone
MVRGIKVKANIREIEGEPTYICDRCNGSGEIYNTLTGNHFECMKCGGTGEVETERLQTELR